MELKEELVKELTKNCKTQEDFNEQRFPLDILNAQTSTKVYLKF